MHAAEESRQEDSKEPEEKVHGRRTLRKAMFTSP
ncbi:hypothetical protein HNE_0210 [Hyphomonas neptunium ATCC 15444]|uniref:Uncharacterized protein n=1 Tax=Hyphomonas neptunium (strain ATCC 15444) TaxID=228405 RepID=Q0C5Q0_HYPNA|nr:hypothetical protein HNE_0210 [Hyphomonas neptunium ATCC 15444]